MGKALNTIINPAHELLQKSGLPDPLGNAIGQGNGTPGGGTAPVVAATPAPVVPQLALTQAQPSATVGQVGSQSRPGTGAQANAAQLSGRQRLVIPLSLGGATGGAGLQIPGA